MKLVDDELRAIALVPARIKRDRVSLYTAGENSISFKLLDSSNKATLPLPLKVRITEENDKLFKIAFLYLPNEAPRSGTHVNIEAFAKQTFILITGTDADSGKSIGKIFQNMSSLGFSYLILPGDEQRYEQIVCVSEEPRSWDNLKFNLKKIGLAMESSKNS